MAARGFYTYAQVQSEVRFTELIEAIEISLNAALVEWADHALRAIHDAAPVGTGQANRRISPGVHLRDSFKVAIQRMGFSGFGAMISVWTANPNAIWQELGTKRGVPATYFMRNGFNSAYPTGIALVEAALGKAGEHVVGTPMFGTAGAKGLAKHGPF